MVQTDGGLRNNTRLPETCRSASFVLQKRDASAKSRATIKPISKGR